MYCMCNIPVNFCNSYSRKSGCWGGGGMLQISMLWLFLFLFFVVVTFFLFVGLFVCFFIICMFVFVFFHMFVSLCFVVIYLCFCNIVVCLFVCMYVCVCWFNQCFWVYGSMCLFGNHPKSQSESPKIRFPDIFFPKCPFFLIPIFWKLFSWNQIFWISFPWNQQLEWPKTWKLIFLSWNSQNSKNKETLFLVSLTRTITL